MSGAGGSSAANRDDPNVKVPQNSPKALKLSVAGVEPRIREGLFSETLGLPPNDVLGN